MVISREEPLWCNDERRNAVLRAPGHPLNGVDFVEYRFDPLALPSRRHRLEVTFLKPPPAGLIGTPAAFRLEGGVRIVGIQILDVAGDPDPNRLVVFASQAGDLSLYILRVLNPAIDAERSEAAFSFRAGCAADFDCRPRSDCEPGVTAEPALDYLAKDYQSFRRLLLDLLPQLNPDWTERSPADLGVTLVELFAYVGDYLSYFQDAAATEAFFDTCRDRVSATRHARLIDYRVHNGRNAATFVRFEGVAGAAGTVPAGTRLLTRIVTPLRGETAPPGVVIAPGTADFDGDLALSDVTVFETAVPVAVNSDHNLLHIHSWGDAACCLAAGAREAWLFGLRPAGADQLAFRPALRIGDYLLLEEVLGARTGIEADADIRHRQVVRIELTEDTADLAYRDRLVGGVLTPATGGDPRLPLQNVRWRQADALAFPLCLSAEHPETGELIAQIAVARGNVTPADHGRTVVRAWHDPPQPGDMLPRLNLGTGRAPPEPATIRWPIPMQSFGEGPLTYQAMPRDPVFAPDGRLTTGRHDLDIPPSAAMPAAVVEFTYEGGETEIWNPVPSLLDSGVYDPHFVAETDANGLARLRFGDDQYGRRPGEPIAVQARYRIGNGRSGNIGAETLLHVVTPEAADLTDPANPDGGPLPFPGIAGIYQPLPARGGADPQAIEEIRQLAPEAFRAETFRAVTEPDYEAATIKQPGVAAAKASFNWTGSWHTVFVAIHPLDPDDLDPLPGGGAVLKPGFADRLSAALVRYKLAGYDLVVRAATYVPIELDIQICVARGHFRGDVLEVATAALSNRRLTGGVLGFFHPSRFRFGSPVYASRIYEALHAIDGVDSATIRVFKRYWDQPNGELERGVIPMGPFEIARLDNDRNQPEFGVLRLTAVGGL